MEKNIFYSSTTWITGGIFFLAGSFITYLFSNFCFDTSPSLREILRAFFIFSIGGFILGFLIGWGVSSLMRRRNKNGKR